MKEQNSKNIIPIEQQIEMLPLDSAKSFLKMARRIDYKLGGRFDLKTTGQVLSHNGRNYIEVGSKSGTTLMSLSSVGDSTLSPDKPVRMISGTCLFGATGLKGMDRMGEVYYLADPLAKVLKERIVSIEEMKEVHPSEVESTLRLAQAFAVLDESSKVRGKDVLHFHLPVPEYLLYLLQYFNDGGLSEELVDKGVDLVVARGEKVKQLFTNRLPANLKVEVHSSLDSVLPDLLARGAGLGLSEITSLLARRDSLWAKLLAHTRPGDFRVLNDLSYTHMYHKAHQQAQLEGVGCMAVDESKEGPIFTEVKSQAKAMNKPMKMNALYIAPKTISIDALHGKTELFMHRTESEPLLMQLKQIVQIYYGEK